MDRIAQLLIDALLAQIEGRKVAPPEAGLLIWRAFLDLTRTRSWQKHGPDPITQQEIEAWCRLNRLPLTARHIAVIRQMDDAYVSDARGKLIARTAGATDSAPQGVPLLPRLSKHPLTTELLDAMLGA